MKIITDTPSLKAVCDQLRCEDFVTVDTEFMRETTYWPQLCLIQLAGSVDEVIVDPLSSDLDLTAFFDLMADTGVLKVFHAARQDIEIIYYLGGIIPQPVFDTQVAAMVCGFGDQIGYEALVRKLVQQQIDKSSRFTDWSRRPLSKKQLDYALSDVTYLRVIYEKLQRQLDISGRESWLSEEMEVLTSSKTYENEPGNAYKRIKFRARNKRQIAILRSLAAWREREAQSRNQPRNRIMKDDALAEIAVQKPVDTDALGRLRAVPKGFAQSRNAAGLLEAVNSGLKAGLDDLPDINAGRPDIPEGTGAIADILKLALKVIAEREGIAPKLLCSAADVERIAARMGDRLPAMTGWRYEAFGRTAERLMAGELVIGLENGKPNILQAGAPSQPRAAAE